MSTIIDSVDTTFMITILQIAGRPTSGVRRDRDSTYAADTQFRMSGFLSLRGCHSDDRDGIKRPR